MKRGGKGLSTTVLAAVAVGAVGLGVVVALLAGYFLGHFTSKTKTTTVTFAAAASSHNGPSKQAIEEEEAAEGPVEEEAEPQEAEAPAGGEAAGKKNGGAEGKKGGEGKKKGGEAATGKGSQASGGEEAALKTGKGIVENTCSSCHTLSEAGATGTVGPNLDELKPSQELVETQVTNGGGVMPAFKGTLSTEEIEDVAEYVSKVAGTGDNSAG